MKSFETLVLLSTLSTSILAAESSRPRGVGPEFAKFYKSTESFACISNPSIILAASQINDDYCDCPDGSDEPGTSACTSLSALSPSQPISAGHPDIQLVLPGFYCKNKGHIPGYVSHTYVNDGVCDYDACCDGSDEWKGVGGRKCEDRCKEIGKEWRKQDEVKQKSMRNALRKKEELIREAKSLRDGVVSQIAYLEAEIKGLEIKEKEAKKKYDDVERRERGKIISAGKEGSKASKVTVLAGLARKRIDELRGTLFNVVSTRNKLRIKVRELEEILTTFAEEYNPNFNDEGVKRAVKAWQDYAAKTAALPALNEAAEDNDVDSVSAPDSETEGINFAEFENEEESDVDALYQFEAYLPLPVRTWIHEKLTSLRILLIENGILADTANSGTESAAVTTARQTHQGLVDNIQTKRDSIISHQADLTKDYGPSEIFRSLKDKCITTDSGEYTYELCFLGSTSQKSKKGHGNTNMGNFVRLDTVVVDEEVGADGRGLGKGQRTVLKFEGGQNCWNGPNRETTVVLGCAEENEIWKVAETEKCLYRMEVGSPVACEKPGGFGAGKGDGKGDGDGKDEL